MALLQLSGIGKIYVSEGSVAVGIRGVDLSFDKGELVAVTGQSGSGKSTLLNVISGMDTYEEGELYIEGEPTSHYLQPDWEEYRERYISFIFQNYNIIDSFTVLENVELALMHIENKRQRRARALELIERVGLTSHLSHKGSALSGGQKQRTVIARALAKDSPIILADEPTGNLDSATSREIVQLLHEVSRDKLVIVVTHSFDELSDIATRHVRIFDGAVESDTTLRPPNLSEGTEGAADGTDVPKEAPRAEKRGILATLSDGFTLGRSIFAARPKLTVFLCILLIVGTVGIFALTAMCSGASELFLPTYMFEYIPGRVVVAKPTGGAIRADEAAELLEKSGAEELLRFDALLDLGNSYYAEAVLPTGSSRREYTYLTLLASRPKELSGSFIGEYPDKANEVLLTLPISMKPKVGADEIKIDVIKYLGMELEVTGVQYYYDNNITPSCIFTNEGFEIATASYYLTCLAGYNTSVTAAVGNSVFGGSSIVPVFDLEGGDIWISDADFEGALAALLPGDAVDISISGTYYIYDFTSYSSSEAVRFTRTMDRDDIAAGAPSVHVWEDDRISYGTTAVYMDAYAMADMVYGVLDSSYRQISLFFESDKAAHEAAEALTELGYVAVPSDTEYEPDAFSVIMSLVASLIMAGVFVLGVIFLAFFINLCSSRSVAAIGSDIAIMRSMGIPVSVIRTGLYVRMLLSLIPAVLAVALVAVLIYTTPAANAFFTYLYAWQYALIFAGLVALALRVTHKQIKNLFGESVKVALRGGAAQ